MMYKELIQDYHFDDSLNEPLYIPGMEELPPPLPPKKRPRKKQVCALYMYGCIDCVHVHVHCTYYSRPKTASLSPAKTMDYNYT